MLDASFDEKQLISKNDSIQLLTSPSKIKGKTESATTFIGADSFKELVEKSSAFIDKSMFIKEFVNKPVKTLLVTCPRRWGKSINMDMVKTFLEIELDNDKKRYKDKKTSVVITSSFKEKS
jgi:predicted hydrocarbon binding protein